MANVTITELPAAGAITGTESVPIVQNGVTVQTTTAALAGSPVQTQTFLTLNQEPTLNNSRALSNGTGVGLVDGGAQSTLSITLNAASGSLEAASNGMIAKTASNAVAARTMSSTTTGLSVTDGDGVAGNPTFALTGVALAVAGATGTGALALTSSSTVSTRTILGTASQIDITDGNFANSPVIAISADPVLSGNGGLVVPVGTTGQRGSSVNGTLRYNSTTATFEGYANNAWGAIPAGLGVAFVGTGTGLTGGPITSTGTISLADTAVVPASYTYASITVDQQGRITAASNGSVTTGTVTSVAQSFTGGLIAVSGSPITSTGTLALTVAGTSGGVPYFSSGTTWAASGALTANAIVLGGGAGAAPAPLASLGTTTTVLHGNAAGAPTFGAVSLTADVTGTLPIANGGTGATTSAGAAFALKGANIDLTSVALTTGTVSTTPSASTDIANKSYVDTVAQGLDTKASCVAATTVNITLSAPQTVDGIALIAGDRCLVKNQSTTANNGIYLVAAGSWTRALDMDNWAEVPGAYVFIETGTTQADTGWVCTSNAGGTIGVTAITWAQFSGAGSGVSSLNFGTTGLTPASATTGAITVAGTLAVANGGTNITSYAIGDLIYASTAGVLSKLADVATGNALISGGVGVAPSYGKIGLTTHVSGTLPIANGGTNSTATATAGGAGYGTGTAHAYTAAGTSGQVLTSAGASAPTWATPTTGTVTAVSVASANGLAGTSSGGATPALTLSTSITGLLKGNGTAISAATAGTDYLTPTTGVTTFSGSSTGLTPSTATSGAITLAGTLAVANGGTNITTYAIGDLIYASTTGVLSKLADVATGSAIISGGVGVAPSYGKVGLTTHISGVLPVANGGTGLSSGTSGGVLAFTATGTIASSTALAASALVIGGGAGVAPSTTTTATGALTFLGTPSSANLAALLTDETGTGANVFATSPTFTTSINSGVTFTAFAGATTSLTIGGTGATSVFAVPGTLEQSSTTGAMTVAGGVYIAKKLTAIGGISGGTF